MRNKKKSSSARKNASKVKFQKAGFVDMGRRAFRPGDGVLFTNVTGGGRTCVPDQTGNRERTTIVGVDLLSLVTYIMAWPDATQDKMAVFIYNEGGGSLLPPGNIQSPSGA